MRVGTGFSDSVPPAFCVRYDAGLGPRSHIPGSHIPSFPARPFLTLPRSYTVYVPRSRVGCIFLSVCVRACRRGGASLLVLDLVSRTLSSGLALTSHSSSRAPSFLRVGVWCVTTQKGRKDRYHPASRHRCPDATAARQGPGSVIGAASPPPGPGRILHQWGILRVPRRADPLSNFTKRVYTPAGLSSTRVGCERKKPQHAPSPYRRSRERSRSWSSTSLNVALMGASRRRRLYSERFPIWLRASSRSTRTFCSSAICDSAMCLSEPRSGSFGIERVYSNTGSFHYSPKCLEVEFSEVWLPCYSVGSLCVWSSCSSITVFRVSSISKVKRTMLLS